MKSHTLAIACLVQTAAHVGLRAGDATLLEPDRDLQANASKPIQPLRLQLESEELGVMLYETKRCDEVWLVKGYKWVKGEAAAVNSRPVYFRCNFDKCTVELLASSGEWERCQSDTASLRALDSEMKGSRIIDDIRVEPHRVWIKQSPGNKVLSEHALRFRWPKFARTDAQRRWIIALGTDARRRTHGGGMGYGLPNPVYYTFGPPKTLSLEAFTLDLKPLGPVVLLADAELTLPDKDAETGFAWMGMMTARDMPGIIVVGDSKEFWAVSESRFKEAKP